jgi:hypothetical protein
MLCLHKKSSGLMILTTKIGTYYVKTKTPRTLAFQNRENPIIISYSKEPTRGLVREKDRQPISDISK